MRSGVVTSPHIVRKNLSAEHRVHGFAGPVVGVRSGEGCNSPQHHEQLYDAEPEGSAEDNHGGPDGNDIYLHVVVSSLA